MRTTFPALLVTSSLLFSGTAVGAPSNKKDGSDPDECAGLLASGPTQLIASSFQTPQEREEIRRAIAIIFGKDGIAEKLGLAVPPHIVEMMPSEILMALAVLGRHPMPHWTDGRTVVTEGSGARGVMEFATSGCPTCRSFYRDTTNFWEQIEILFHVAGHNDFSEHSIFARSRPSDVMGDSRKLADMISQAYLDYGKAEVNEFVQHMLVTANLQDFARGTFELPGKTSPNTPSILQALSAYMTPETAAWKRALLEQFEKVQRFFPYVVTTKTMNEGWATFLMELMLRHSPWANTAQGFVHGNLMRGVAHPSIGNPYWLGREAWNRVYARFLERADIRALPTQLERDRAFVSFAHAQYIDNKNDAQFLSEALDVTWVTKNNLLLSRPLTKDEQDPNLPPPPPGKFKKPVQKMVASRDPQAIIRSIVTQVADRGRQFPRLRLDPNSRPGALVFVQDATWGVPLQVKDLGPALHALQKVTGGARIRLRALVRNLPGKVDTGQIRAGWIDIELGKNDALLVHETTSSGLSSETLSKYRDQIRKTRDSYLQQSERLYLKYSQDPALTPEQAAELARDHTLRMQYLLRTTTDQAPTLAQALEEYQNMLQFSQNVAVSSLLNGDSTQEAIKVTSRGVSLGILPGIPEITLDRSAQDAVVEGVSPLRQSLSAPIAGAKKEGDLDQGPYAPDEKFYGEDNSPSQGQGQGEGEEGDGEPKEGDEPGGQRPGGKGKDPTVAKFPLELWGKLLQKYLELPNLRRTQGQSEMADTQRSGGVHRPNGEILWHRTAMDAIGWGKLILKQKGLLKPTTSHREIMLEGLKYMPRSLYTVADREPSPQPEMSAVVVFVVDKSGSMGGDPLNIAQNAVFNILALLKAAYPKVEARFVAFDDKAMEAKQHDFFNSTMGGGTKYTSGIELTQEILQKFPKEKWNRYVYFFGDGDDSNEDATREGMRALAADIEFMGFGLVDPSGRNINGKLATATRQLAREVPWFGFAHIDKTARSMFQALRSFFGKRPEKQ